MKRYVLKPRPVDLEFFRDLDEDQRNAVLNSQGRSLVIAGPGSGKTRVIVYKLVHLLKRGVDPSEIMLVTFTRAAAREMIERAKELTRSDLKGLTAGTFHSVANHFLRRYAQLLGYSSNYTVLDREDAKDLMGHARTRVLEKFELDKKSVPKAGPLLAVYSYMVNTMSDMEDVLRERMPKFLENSWAIEEIFKTYESEKMVQNTMDYDDLLKNFLKLLKENETVRQRLSDRFRWILVDEFQDTNILQYSIVEILASKHGNVFVVGDDAQSIYSFRGARYENVEDFMKVEGTKLFKIEMNYRSTESIVNLINSMIPKRAVPKVLKAFRKDGKKPVIVKTFSRDDQAMFVVQRIEELLKEGTPLDEIAVLFRSNAESLELQAELTAHRIPYRILAGMRFTEQAHVKDVLALLKIIQNPRDVIAWVRVARLFSGIGEKTASGIAMHFLREYKPGDDIVETLEGFKPPRKSDFSSLVDLFRALAGLESPAQIMEVFLESFYRDYLYMSYFNSRDRERDLEILVDIARRYDSVEKFLSDMIVSEDFTPAPDMESGEKLTLSTVHQAKGLEWKVVFVISVNPGSFPIDLAVSEGKMDEEERLFYVAISRAKDELYIIHQENWGGHWYGYPRFVQYEGFVERIPKELVEEWEIS